MRSDNSASSELMASRVAAVPATMPITRTVLNAAALGAGHLISRTSSVTPWTKEDWSKKFQADGSTQWPMKGASKRKKSRACLAAPSTDAKASSRPCSLPITARLTAHLDQTLFGRACRLLLPQRRRPLLDFLDAHRWLCLHATSTGWNSNEDMQKANLQAICGKHTQER